jgi:hypothetical protein
MQPPRHTNRSERLFPGKADASRVIRLLLLKSIATVFILVTLNGPLAFAQESSTDTRPGVAPDIREDDINLKLQRGDLVAVPIPISNPTLDSGLVVGAAYFYPQNEAQKKLQPASVTAAAGMYTNNDSKAFALVQQNYWNEDRWRFTGAIGLADLRLSLGSPEDSDAQNSLAWRINGAFLFAKVARNIKGNWYGGVQARVIDAEQSIESFSSIANFDSEPDVRSAGMGLILEYDSRDMPINSYSGSHLQIDAIFNDEKLGSNKTYQSYSAAYRSYHRLTDSSILAWEMQGCIRSGTAPLWDACTIKLRGFSATDYLGQVSTSGQLEARWQMNKRWGLVGFAGAGYAGDTYTGLRDREVIPSYGLGVRFMVLAAKRINVRLDYARSADSDAIHLSVGEAF